MYKKKLKKIFFVSSLILLISITIYSKFFKNDKSELVQEENKDEIYNSNIIKDVEYTTIDKDGNEYIVRSEEGEIDFSNSNIIFLKNVNAEIKLNGSDKINIISDFGKYNSENYDTIFSKNLKIYYLNNKITGEYLDFSLERNSMIISKNVVYYNINNVLKADVIEMDLKTKDTKIFMHDNKNKVEINKKN